VTCVRKHTSNHLVPEIKFYGRAWRDRKGICQAWYDRLTNDIMGLPWWGARKIKEKGLLGTQPQKRPYHTHLAGWFKEVELGYPHTEVERQAASSGDVCEGWQDVHADQQNVLLIPNSVRVTFVMNPELIRRPSVPVMRRCGGIALPMSHLLLSRRKCKQSGERSIQLLLTAYSLQII